MSEFHFSEEDRKRLLLTDDEINSIECAVNTNFPPHKFLPVNMVAVMCDRRLFDGSLCQKGLALFKRDSGNRRFYVDVNEDDLDSTHPFKLSDNKEKRRIQLQIWKNTALAIGDTGLLPTNGRRREFQCVKCGKNWRCDVDKLSHQVRLLADSLEEIPVAQWVDGESLQFYDYAFERARGSYPIIGISTLLSSQRN